MNNKSVQIVKTSELELTQLIKNLDLKNSKLIILDPHKKTDLVLNEKWASLEFTNLINSTETN
jgi:hypothetical protein